LRIRRCWPSVIGRECTFTKKRLIASVAVAFCGMFRYRDDWLAVTCAKAFTNIFEHDYSGWRTRPLGGSRVLRSNQVVRGRYPTAFSAPGCKFKASCVHCIHWRVVRQWARLVISRTMHLWRPAAMPQLMLPIQRIAYIR